MPAGNYDFPCERGSTFYYTTQLFGEKIEVKASIKTLQGISSHADCDGLIKWVNNFDPRPQQVFIVHGQDEVCDIFAKRLHDEYGINSYAPYPGAKFDVNNNKFVDEGVKEKIKKKISPTSIRPNSPYGRLIIAGQRLNTIISKNEGLANKELAKFADQLNSLCEKWDR